MAQLGCERPRQPPAGRPHWFPHIHPQLSWLRNAIFKILRLFFFFPSKKYLYLHKTIKSEQFSPEKLWPSGAAAGHMRRSPFTSNSFSWQYSAGTFSFFWCKDSLSLWSFPCWLFALTGLYLQQQPGSGRFLFVQPSLWAWRVAQDGGLSTLSHLLSVIKLQSQRSEQVKLISYYKKTIFTCSAHLKKRGRFPGCCHARGSENLSRAVLSSGMQGFAEGLVEASFSSLSWCAIPSEGRVSWGTEELRQCTGTGWPGQARGVPRR